MNKVEVLKLAKENGLLIGREFHATQIRTYAFDELLAFANACEKLGMEKAARICDGLAERDYCVDVRIAAAAIRAAT